MWCRVNFIIFIAGFCYVAPASSLIDAFQLGSERTYSLENLVEINDVESTSDSIGYKLTGSVKVGTVWSTDNEKFLKFELITPQLYVKPTNKRSDYTLINSPLQSAKNDPFYAHWNLGKIPRIYANSEEEISILNLKKGIVSLFQYQLLDGNFIEEDVSGLCNVEYESKSSTKYFKTKNNCKTKTDTDVHSRQDLPLGYFIKSTRQTEYFVTSDGIVNKVDSREYFKTYLVSNQKVGSTIESLLNLKFDGSISNVDTIEGDSFDSVAKKLNHLKQMSLVAVPEIDEEKITLIKLIKEYKKDLINENVGKENLALALVKIIHDGRQSKVEEYIRILNAHSTKAIKSQILDIMGAAQTVDAHEAFKKVLDCKTEKDSIFCERYLQALAVGTRPQIVVINDLLSLAKEKIKNNSMWDTLVQTIASMGQRYAKLPGKNYKNVENIESFLVTSLAACKKDDECKQRFIRGLQNFQSPTTIPILFEHALNGDRLVSVTAVKALRTFSSDNWTKEMRKNFENIFYQKTKRFDSSARTISLDILLELKPNLDDLQNMFTFLKSSDKAYEVKQYLLQRFRMISEVCPLFRSKINTILKSDPTLNNYHIIGQRGLSTALSRTFSSTPSFNASLISIQEVYSGVLKRGIVDMVMEADDSKFSVFSLGMYAGGLSSFIGGSDESDSESDDEEATAGMELIVQGSYLRPLQFFKGQGELMGHVWSGTASDSLPAYQATTLLQDHFEYIRLQNGAVVTFKVIGAVSIDLNGQVKFSLWSRNANSKVEKNTAFVVIGKISLNNLFINLQNEFTVTQEPKLNLESKIDFSSDIMLCMQLSQPQTVLKHNTVKQERVPNAKHSVKYLVNHKYNLPGYTHALNQKNNEMCNSIFG